MRRTISFLLVVGLVFICYGSVIAQVSDYASGTYQTPDGWDTIATQQPIDLDHYSYYQWGLDDLNWINGLDQINIVFYGIHDWRWDEEDVLRVYIKNGKDVEGWQQIGWDGESTSSPDWAEMGFTLIGSWSDPYGWPYYLPEGQSTVSHDVVFSIKDSNILALLQDGNAFTIGIDPDCHYWGEKITVEAPVPEPASVLLLGSGLLSLALLGRKKAIFH